MLSVGVDWAEEFHLVALGRPGDGVVEVGRVEHRPEAIAALRAKIDGLEPDPTQVRVVIETRHGLLVEAFLEAGYTVLPVNPDLVARRRGPARKKDDAEDAKIGCLLGLDRFTNLRPLLPHSEIATELRAIARDDERLARDAERLLHRLRSDLVQTFPAILDVIGGDRLGSRTSLQLLQAWPSEAALRGATREQLVALGSECRHKNREQFADRIAATMAAEHFSARQALARAKSDTISFTASQLLLIRAQRRAWKRRMGELLLGAPRRGVAQQPREGEKGESFPNGEIYLSFPGLGDRLAARVAGEVGDRPEQFVTPNGLQCYAGKAPVTRRSGKSQLVVAHRLSCNRFLAEAVQRWAFASLSLSGWAREFYDAKRASGRGHHSALRALANRWLEVLWHCLNRRVLYSEAVHVANRNRARGVAT